MDELEIAIRTLFKAFGMDAVMDVVCEVAEELDPLPENPLVHILDHDQQRLLH
jgi:hypothetical protein